jgi:hypothetical protein
LLCIAGNVAILPMVAEYLDDDQPSGRKCNYRHASQDRECSLRRWQSVKLNTEKTGELRKRCSKIEQEGADRKDERGNQHCPVEAARHDALLRRTAFRGYPAVRLNLLLRTARGAAASTLGWLSIDLERHFVLGFHLHGSKLDHL